MGDEGENVPQCPTAGDARDASVTTAHSEANRHKRV